MTELSDIRALYEAYIAEVERLERERKPGEGIFGLKGGPADDPCHDRFVDQLRTLLGAFASEAHSPDELRDALSYIYSVPLAHREPRSAYWMLIAVHGLTQALAEKLDPPSAQALRRQYEKDYPRWERLPVQRQLLELLKKRS